MKLYSCDFEGCTATTETLRMDFGWCTVEVLPRGMWLLLAVSPVIGPLTAFITNEGSHLCPEHAKRIKGLVRT